MNAIVLLEPARRVGIVLAKLLDDITADIGIVLLDALRDLEHVFRWDVGRLAAVSEQLLGEEGEVLAGNGDVLDGGANDIAVGYRNDVGDTITRVDHSAGKRAVLHLFAGPGGSKGENSLDSNVETLDVEGLKHDFGHVFSVFWRI